MNIALLLAATLSAPTVIENVRIESGSAPIESATVVIDQGRIVSVTPGKLATPVPQATQVDGTGKVLTAGLIETRSQIGVAEVLLEGETVDDRMKEQALAPGFRVCDGYNPMSIRIPITRAAGITSIVVSPQGEVLSGTGCWADLTGTLAGRPDPTRPLAMFGSITSQDAKHFAGGGGSRGGIWLAIRQAFDDARLHRRSANRPSERELSLSSQHLEALYPVLDGKLPLVLTAHRASDILTALDLAKAEKVRLVLAGASEAWLVAKQLKEARVPVIIQPSEQLPYGFDLLNARDDLPALLERAGVTVILTTGIADDQNARRLRYEAGIAVANGMSREGALRAITTTPAEVFDRGVAYGSITAGKRADLVLWSGDPFELSTQVERVWIEGNPMALDNRQRQLAERYLREHD
ncbi:MAG TPA: amidohydrolase family protein [Myxococcota bacterium]|nr:amidohydrolase family protein [Myxococcota bacterium]